MIFFKHSELKIDLIDLQDRIMQIIIANIKGITAKLILNMDTMNLVRKIANKPA